MSVNRRIALLGCLFLLLLSSPLLAGPQPELIILNWDDYLDPELVAEFEKTRHATVTQIRYASDENRTEQLLATDARGFDLIVTSGIDLRRYAKRGWLAPIDESRIPNLANISTKWRNVFPEASEFGVPYFWGTLGIVYRKDLVDQPIRRWKQFFEPSPKLRGHIGLIDDPREIISMALKSLGYSANSEDKSELDEVRSLLRNLRPHIKSFVYVALDESSSLLNGEIIAAMAYNGDALRLSELDENISYVLPEEGGNIWVDFFTLSAHSKNTGLAYEFLDFINDPKHAAQQARYVYFATPNEKAEKYLDREFLNDPMIYPDAKSLQKSEFYEPVSPRGQKLRDVISAEAMR